MLSHTHTHTHTHTQPTLHSFPQSFGGLDACVCLYACLYACTHTHTRSTTDSVFLACETPAVEIPGVIPRPVSDLAGYIFNGIFVAEAFAKIRAFGFFSPRYEAYPAYWKEGWNRLDFFVLIVTLLELSGLAARLGNNSIRVLRVMRALRPLRLMNK